MALLVASGIAWSFYRLAALIGQVRWGIRGGFLAVIGGLISYSYLALQMPGSPSLTQGSVSRGVFLATLAGALLGLLITWSWRTITTQQAENEKTPPPDTGSAGRRYT
jgi:hypothetical protein